MLPNEILEMMNQAVENAPKGMRTAYLVKLIAAKEKEARALSLKSARAEKLLNKAKQGKNHE